MYIVYHDSAESVSFFDTLEEAKENILQMCREFGEGEFISLYKAKNIPFEFTVNIKKNN